MPAFLIPHPTTATSHPSGSEKQRFSGSSLSLSSKTSSNGFDHASCESSGSGTAYLTDVTPPITPSRNNRGKKAVLFNAVDAVRVRLVNAEPTRHTQRALGIMEKRTNPTFLALNLLEEPLLAPYVPTMKVVVDKAEEASEDWSGDFELNGSEEPLAMPLPEEAEDIAAADVSSSKNKDQHCQIYTENEIDSAFEEDMEDAERRVFSDEHNLHLSNAAFADDISGWQEGLISIPDVSVENVEIDSEYPAVAVSNLSVEQEFYSISYLQDSLSPTIPEISDELDWEASALALDNPSLIFDPSPSISQLLISPNANRIPSSPGVNVNSHSHPNPFLNPPIISSLMFSYLRTQPPIGDMAIGPQNSNLPALMDFEVVATMTPQQQEDEKVALIENHPTAGLGFEIAPSQLPESSFPTYNSHSSLQSLHSWDPSYMHATSTPAPLWESTMDSSESFVTASSSFEELESFGPMMELFIARPRGDLSIITEESSRALSLANAGSSKDFYGLGFSAIVESTFQTLASISHIRSPPRPSITGTLSVSMSLIGMTDMWHDSIHDDEDDELFYSAFESPSDFERHQQSLTTGIADVCNVSFFTGIEASGIRPDAPNMEPRRFSPGVVNWLLQCSEVGSLSPLNAEIISHSPSMLNLNMVPGYSWYSEIEPSGVLSEEKSFYSGGAPRLHGQLRASPSPPVHQSVDASPLPAVAAPDSPIEEVASNPFPASVSLGSSGAKIADGIGMGLPSNLSSRAPRPHDVTSGGRDYISMMSAAEECLDMARLSDASPATGLRVSEERGRSRGFFKIPKLSRRRLSAIPEVTSPRLSTWSNLTSRLRSPGRQSGSGSFATPLPLAGPSGDNSNASDYSATMVPTQHPVAPPSTAKNATLPQSPRLVPKQPRSLWIARLSGSASSPPLDHEGGGSLGMIERLDVPCGLGIFKRKVSPEAKSPQAKKENRLQPMIHTN